MLGITSILGAVASAVSSALSVVGKIFISVANAITTLANVLGLTKTEKAEDLGDRVIQAEEEGISPDKYNTYAEYMKAIDDFEIDEEKSNNIPKEDKVLRGLDASSKVLEEKYPNNDITGLLASAALSSENQEYFTSERFSEIAKEIEKNPDIIDSFSKLLNNEEMSADEYYDLLDTMTSIEQKLHPEQTESEISDRLRQLGSE